LGLNFRHHALALHLTGLMTRDPLSERVHLGKLGVTGISRSRCARAGNGGSACAARASGFGVQS